MQINREQGNVPNAITAYAVGEIRMRDRVFRASLIATRDAVIAEWKHRAGRAAGHRRLRGLLELSPRDRDPRHRCHAAHAATANSSRRLRRTGIGLEVMDTGAACRTYNLLLSEYREVAIALII